MNMLARFLIVLAFAGWVAQVQAIVITDRWTDDLNIITGVVQNNADAKLTISEVYGEDNKIPFPSHDGNAVVDNDPDEKVRFFDKIVDLENDTSDWLFEFSVTNKTRWDWSDYHFEFYDADFVNALDVSDILLGWSNTVVFQNSALNFNELQFWAPSHHIIDQTAEYSLLLKTDALPRTFGIRQIATVPVPATFALFGLGLAGLGWSRRKKA